MKLTDKEYLEQILRTTRLELREIEIKHRIAIAEFNIKNEILQKQIDSIELQLDETIK